MAVINCSDRFRLYKLDAGLINSLNKNEMVFELKNLVFTSVKHQVNSEQSHLDPKAYNFAWPGNESSVYIQSSSRVAIWQMWIRRFLKLRRQTEVQTKPLN